MAIIQPCKVALRACNIGGADVRKHTQSIFFYSTICKPYLTATIVINDTSNIINNLQLRGGEKVAFAIDTGIGKILESVQYIISIDEAESQDNLRSMVYTITTASESYFNDRAGMVQRSDVNIPATAAAQLIHSEHVGTDAPLNILMNSIGMLAKSDIGGFLTTNKKPFKAIEDILSRASYGGIKTGTTVHFRNAEEYIIAPLEHLFNTMSASETFIQKQTWGADWRDTFNSYNAIIHASTKINEGGKQRGGMNNIAAAAKGALNIFDSSQGKELIAHAAKAAESIAGGLAEIGQAFGKGKYGGIPNVVQFDSRRNDPSTEQSFNTLAENMFKAQVKDSVNYTIKVPIQTGINVLAGYGFNAKLIPPTGDLHKGYQAAGGLMLAADVSHQCTFTDTLVQGVTVIRGVQVKYNA